MTRAAWWTCSIGEAKVESVEYGQTIQVVAVCGEKTVGQVREYVIDGWQPSKEFWED